MTTTDEEQIYETLVEALSDSSRQSAAVELWYNLLNRASEVGEPLWTLSLSLDYRAFRSALHLLRRWGREFFPSVNLGGLVMPVNPTNPHVMFADDPVSEELRTVWRKDYSGPLPTGEGYDVIGMPVQSAIDIFAKRIATSAAQSASPSSKLVKFTVKTRQHGFRILRTDVYWYQPKVFGGIKTSTPVDDRIYPGTYKFGGDNFGVVKPIWDPVTHPVSASSPSTTLTVI